MNAPFKVDIRAIRNRARERPQEGAVTPSYGLEVKEVVEVLNAVLASELVCNLRYLSQDRQARLRGGRREPNRGEKARALRRH